MACAFLYHLSKNLARMQPNLLAGRLKHRIELPCRQPRKLGPRTVAHRGRTFAETAALHCTALHGATCKPPICCSRSAPTSSSRQSIRTPCTNALPSLTSALSPKPHSAHLLTTTPTLPNPKAAYQATRHTRPRSTRAEALPRGLRRTRPMRIQNVPGAGPPKKRFWFPSPSSAGEVSALRAGLPCQHPHAQCHYSRQVETFARHEDLPVRAQSSKPWSLECLTPQSVVWCCDVLADTGA